MKIQIALKAGNFLSRSSFVPFDPLRCMGNDVPVCRPEYFVDRKKSAAQSCLRGRHYVVVDSATSKATAL